MYGLNDFNFVAVGNVLPTAAANISDSADGCLAVCDTSGFTWISFIEYS